mgnify:CR=1 FL=1
MLKYTCPFARLQEWNHPYPTRTAYRATTGWDYVCQVWSSRGAMLQAVKMSQTGMLGAKPWKPLVETKER